jgi:putative membrane protein
VAQRDSEVAIDMMGWYPGGWAAWGGIGMVGMVVVWAALIALAVWVVTLATRSSHERRIEQETPRTILDRRFASGEIDADTYARSRRILSGSEGSPLA